MIIEDNRTRISSITGNIISRNSLTGVKNECFDFTIAPLNDPDISEDMSQNIANSIVQQYWYTTKMILNQNSYYETNLHF